jgi:hypothetical protein
MERGVLVYVKIVDMAVVLMVEQKLEVLMERVVLLTVLDTDMAVVLTM